ncbi:hypothetical protein FRC11_007369 [Ceratobasidium sp. 423]|nr:hypothetical protein FRC11_007369 [Ceratobasidium sp. 423]
MLYFHDWVHDYRQLFDHWAQSVLPAAGDDLPGSSKGGYRPRELWERLKNCQDSRLRNEFTLAKETFFRPGAPMRLNIPDEDLNPILDPPNITPSYNEQELTNKMPSFPNQPEPSIFDPIMCQVYDALNSSFARFIKLAFCNAGLWHCVPGACGGAMIFAGGLAMWSIGMTSHRRGYVAGSLPIIWVGLWFMLVTLSGHCLTVYVTGDARQLYPWEIERPLPPDVVPPPVYSLAPAPAPDELIPTSPRSPACYSLLLTRPSLPTSQHTYQSRVTEGKRWSEGALKMLGRCKDDDKSADLQALDRQTELGLLDRLPPARKTKDLPRNSLVTDAERANTLGQMTHSPVLTPSPKGSASDLSQRRNAVVDLPMELTMMRLGPEGQPDSPFSEENDFGIILSEPFEEDEVPEMHHFSNTPQPNSASILNYEGSPPSYNLPSMSRSGDEQYPISSRLSPLTYVVRAIHRLSVSQLEEEANLPKLNKGLDFTGRGHENYMGP